MIVYADLSGHYTKSRNRKSASTFPEKSHQQPLPQTRKQGIPPFNLPRKSSPDTVSSCQNTFLPCIQNTLSGHPPVSFRNMKPSAGISGNRACRAFPFLKRLTCRGHSFLFPFTTRLNCAGQRRNSTIFFLLYPLPLRVMCVAPGVRWHNGYHSFLSCKVSPLQATSKPAILNTLTSFPDAAHSTTRIPSPGNPAEHHHSSCKVSPCYAEKHTRQGFERTLTFLKEYQRCLLL